MSKVSTIVSYLIEPIMARRRVGGDLNPDFHSTVGEEP